MLSRYSEIFRPSGTKAFATAAFFARMPIAMAPVGIVAMLSQTRGEFWLAGAVSATFALANALIAPYVSRLIDRIGQARILIPATVISVLSFAALVMASSENWPMWTLFVSALLAATMPSIPAMVRARWSEIFRDRPELATAFAFESVADELVYISGASLSVGLSVSLFPEAGMLASTMCLALGSAAFVAQRSTEPAVRSTDVKAGRSAIGLLPVRVITLALIFVGTTFATAEVSVVAITKDLGQPGAASPIIGVYAMGSFVVGLVLGGLRPSMPLERQLVLAVAILALTTLPLLVADTVLLLGLAVFVSGAAISPTFISAFGLIERRVPEVMLTEGVTWATTGIGIGMAFGSFAAGWVIDSFGAQNGFWVSVAAGAASLVTVLLGQRTLAGPRGEGAAEPSPL
jgi:MFS family permease